MAIWTRSKAAKERANAVAAAEGTKDEEGKEGPNAGDETGELPPWTQKDGQNRTEAGPSSSSSQQITALDAGQKGRSKAPKTKASQAGRSIQTVKQTNDGVSSERSIQKPQPEPSGLNLSDEADRGRDQIVAGDDGANVHNIEGLERRWPPVLGLDGRPIDTAFPAEIVQTVLVHDILTSNRPIRVADIDRIRIELNRSEHQLRQYLSQERPEAYDALKEAKIDDILRGWQPSDSDLAETKWKWSQLSEKLKHLVKRQEDEDELATTLTQSAMCHLKDMFKLFFKLPEAVEYKDRNVANCGYRPIQIPSNGASEAAAGGDANASDQYKPPEHITEQVAEDLSELRMDWQVARYDLGMAQLQFQEWAQAKHYAEKGYESSDIARRHIERGRTLVGWLRQAERDYSEACTVARRARAIGTDLLSAHFPRYRDSELRGEWLEEAEVSMLRTEMPRIQRWVERVASSAASPENVWSLQSSPAGLSSLCSLEFCEDSTQIRHDRDERLIEQNNQRSEDEFRTMLDNWPKRIERPSTPHGPESESEYSILLTSSKRRRSDGSEDDSDQRGSKRSKTSRSTMSDADLTNSQTQDSRRPPQIDSWKQRWTSTMCEIL